jgi:hypothetical protein
MKLFIYLLGVLIIAISLVAMGICFYSLEGSDLSSRGELLPFVSIMAYKVGAQLTPYYREILFSQMGLTLILVMLARPKKRW